MHFLNINDINRIDNSKFIIWKFQRWKRAKGERATVSVWQLVWFHIWKLKSDWYLVRFDVSLLKSDQICQIQCFIFEIWECARKSFYSYHISIDVEHLSVHGFMGLLMCLWSLDIWCVWLLPFSARLCISTWIGYRWIKGRLLHVQLEALKNFPFFGSWTLDTFSGRVVQRVCWRDWSSTQN